MPLNRIVFPHSEFVLPRRFVVIVLATPDVTKVTTVVTPPKGGAAKVVDTVMTRQGDRCPRWKIVIQGALPDGMDEGVFGVTITGFTGERGDIPANSLKQSVTVARNGWSGESVGMSKDGDPLTSDIEITYPPNDHVTTPEEYAGGLVTWGSFTNGNEAVSATMNTTQPDYLANFGDEWYAVFPPMADGSYTLLVVNSANDSDSVTVEVEPQMQSQARLTEKQNEVLS
jgi:hypothetical protein